VPVLINAERDVEPTALVRAAQGGDRAAFGTLYERYARMVHGILLAHVSPDDVDDLMQDVFMRALEQLDSLKDGSAFGGWLMTIARHSSADFHRRRKNMTIETDLGGGSRPDGEAFAILDSMRRLPEAYRETLVLRLVEGMTGPEIAARTGLTPASVRVNLCRGIRLLREIVGGHAKL
jgi:RNA polymerase sigma-70 factor, ECF subfamily